MNRDQANLAIAAGHSWAERKADTLLGEIPAHDWPDVWEDAWNPKLPFRESEVVAGDVKGLVAIASHAAAERWRELLREHRGEEDVEDEELDTEAEAERLLQAIRRDLPEGLHADREGERVMLLDRDGFERTVKTLEQAWRIVAEYEERRSLST